MPVAFQTFKNRNRSIRIPIPDADGNTDPDIYLEILYRPEALDDDYTKEQRQFRREVARRTLEIEQQRVAILDAGGADAYLGDLNRAEDDLNDYQMDEGIRLILKIVSGWDMYEDEAMTIPMALTADNFRRLGLNTIVEIQRQMAEQVTFSPNGMSGTGARS